MYDIWMLVKKPAQRRSNRTRNVAGLGNPIADLDQTRNPNSLENLREDIGINTSLESMDLEDLGQDITRIKI